MDTSRDPSDAGTEILDAARRLLGMDADALHLGYFAVGGNHSSRDVHDWLTGSRPIPPTEYYLLAQAVNDEAVGRGLDHPIPYSSEAPER